MYKHGIQEEAHILVRALLELHLDFSVFADLVRSDPKGAARRVVDSIIIEKGKQLRASNYLGIPENVREDVEQWEKEVVSRYSKPDLDKLRRYGFSMMSVEDRARRTENTGLYDVVYRNFSRNTHNNDFMESFLQVGAYEAEEYGRLREARDDVAMHTTFSTVHNVLQFLNSLFDFAYADRIVRLRSRADAMPKVED